MLLTAGALKVALATTHLPLSAVPEAITPHSLEKSLRVLAGGLRSSFGISNPRITVLGLNPHAGENSYMGSEELEVIGPVCDLLRLKGLSITGPISADTAFSAVHRAATDAYLAMFHDQGLPVIKSEGFGEIVERDAGSAHHPNLCRSWHCPITRWNRASGCGQHETGDRDGHSNGLRNARVSTRRAQ